MNIKLYAADINELNNEEVFMSLMEEVDEERRSKVNRLIPEKGKKLSLAAGVLMRQALKAEGLTEYTIEKRENDKPYIAGRDDIYFNLSHSGEVVVCAVSPVEVGCDIELIKEDRPRIAQRFFTEEEQEFSSGSKENFYRMWTLKESFMKVTGKGLQLPMRDYSINMSAKITVKQNVDGRQYFFKEIFDFTGYACSVCTADIAPEDITLIRTELNMDKYLK